MVESFPKHVAIIMDGNGRWASSQGLPRVEGHKAGLKTIRRVIEACIPAKVEVLTLFAFSCENWQRPDAEVTFLMELFMQALSKEVPALHEKGIRLEFIGNINAFSQDLQNSIHMAEKLTESNQQLRLVLAMNYSGQWDICQAVQKLATKVSENILSADDITPECIDSVMATQNLPHPDLFIRTSGEQRISNFFLWQLAYTELFFSPVAWPDFQKEDFNEALVWFASRERRFGRLMDNN